ncbi:MAG: PAS domain S-box protein, partial [Daejeonella sp.]
MKLFTYLIVSISLVSTFLFKNLQLDLSSQISDHILFDLIFGGILILIIGYLIYSFSTLKRSNSFRIKADKHQLSLVNQKLASHLSNSPLALIEWDENFRIVIWSSKAEKIFGWSQAEMQGKHFNDFKFIFEDDEIKVGEIGVQLINGQVQSNMVSNRNYSKSGNIIYCEWYNTVLKDSTGKVTSIMSLIHDVTENKINEESILKSSERFELVVKATNDSLYDWDIENDTIWVNDNYLTSFGYNPKDTPDFHQEWLARVHPDDRERVVASMNGRIADGSDYVESDYRTKMADGSYGLIFNRSLISRDKSGKACRWTGSLMDITERKKQEAELAISESKYRNLVNTMQEGLGVMDNEGHILFLNKYATDMLGYELDELIGKKVETLFEGENLDILRKQRELRKLGSKDNYEITWKTKRGGNLVTLVSPTPVVDDNGEINGAVAVFTDITERRRSEKALEESERRLRSILQTEPDCIKLLDIKGRVIDMNPAGLNIIEAASMDEVRNVEVDSLVAPEYREKFKDLIRRVFEGESCKLEFELIGLKGGRKWLEMYALPFKDNNGNIVNLLGVTRDITVQKKIYLALQISEAKFRKLFEYDLIGFLYFDTQGNILDANDKFLNLVGYTKNDLKEGKLNWKEMTPKEFAPKDGNALQQIQSGGSCVPYEKEYIRKDGTRFPLILGAALNPGEESDKGIAYIIDISKRKKAETELIKSNNLLAEAQKISQIGNWEWLPETDEVFWSDEMFIILGVEPQSFKVKSDTILEFVHPDDVSLVAKATEKALKENKAIPVDYRIIRRDGEIRNISGIGNPTLDENGKLIRMVGSSQDITDRKKVEDNLRQKDRLVEMIYNTVIDIIFMLEVENESVFKFISVNHAFVEATGLKRENVLGKKVQEVIPEPSLSLVLEKYKESIKNKVPVSWEETTNYPSGLRTAMVSIAPIFDDGGICIKLVGSVHDVTEQKRNEEEIKDRNIQLLQLTAHLQNVREEERSRIAVEIHDELGQQLTGLKMDVSWIKRKISDEQPVIKEKLQSLLNLVDVTISSVRRISSDLRPSILDDFGLIDALEWQAKDFEKRTKIK